MNLPDKDELTQRVKSAAKCECPNCKAMIDWFRYELAERRKENDQIGQENRLSEAQCLASILELVDS